MINGQRKKEWDRSTGETLYDCQFLIDLKKTEEILNSMCMQFFLGALVIAELSGWTY